MSCPRPGSVFHTISPAGVVSEASWDATPAGAGQGRGAASAGPPALVALIFRGLDRVPNGLGHLGGVGVIARLRFAFGFGR